MESGGRKGAREEGASKEEEEEEEWCGALMVTGTLQGHECFSEDSYRCRRSRLSADICSARGTSPFPPPLLAKHPRSLAPLFPCSLPSVLPPGARLQHIQKRDDSIICSGLTF